MVSELWFEGFRHTFGCVKTQTKEMVIFLKEKINWILKRFLLIKKGECDVCNQPSSSKWFPNYPYLCIMSCMLDMRITC